MTTSDRRALRILHLSDTHLSGDDSLHYGIVDTHAALGRVLERASELDAIDVVVASGDLSDDGSEASYRALRAAIEPWASARGAVVVYAMGNHDLREGFEAVLGDREGVTIVRGFRIVCLDSSVPGFGYGEVNAAQRERLGAILGQSSENGTILVVHHPPVPASTPLLAALELQEPDALMRTCAAFDARRGSKREVRLILSGHYHHSLATSIAGIPVAVAPGVTNTTDALAPSGTERATIGAGFAVVDIPPVSDEDSWDQAPRVIFVSAPGPRDGEEVFALDPETVERIGRAAGPQTHPLEHRFA